MNESEKEKKKSLWVVWLCITLPLLVMGIWMILRPATQEHQSTEDSSVYFIKEIWGAPAGGILLILSLIVFIWAFVAYKSKRAPREKPASLGKLLYFILFYLLICSVVVYAAIWIQYGLIRAGILPKLFEFKDTGDIHFICITFIVFLSLFTGIFWLFTRKKK